MKQVLVRHGAAVVEEVPAPRVEPGTALVQVNHSCISVGTEMSAVRASRIPLWQRALKQPDNVKRVLRMIGTDGLARTRRAVQGRLEEALPVGYSAAGIVIEVGSGVNDLRPGDRVACAGAQYAYHAEIIRVPRNLVVTIPDGVEFVAASTVTLGAIALQGVRRANPTLGETFAVIGLGILGQLTVQILTANGCRVIGADLDPSRIQRARELGMPLSINPEAGDDVEQVFRYTGGAGADGVVITAATASHTLISQAFRMCRKKGRVVLVGDVGLDLDRNDLYVKELDFLISTSYGPGRYDERYEEKGLEYPLAYVRWTENRNMEAYLRLVADGRVSLEGLISEVHPVRDAALAYARLGEDGAKPLAVLLSYSGASTESTPQRRIANLRARPSGPGRVRIAVVGAGAFAKSVHLPNLVQLADRYEVRAVMSRTGHNAAGTAAQFGAAFSTTEYAELLQDEQVDAILLATRHELHAAMALEALRAGKHVLVEKPLAVSRLELATLEKFYANEARGNTAPVLCTGFNRRFSRYARRVGELVSARVHPMMVNYRMNAGYLPLDHWTHLEAGGGRNVGEACHIYDLFTFLTGSRVCDVQVQTITPRNGHYSRRDNFVATMTFEDGSLASLTYTALGNAQHPKEQMELYSDGRVIVLTDYRRLTVAGGRINGFSTRIQQKGHREELEAFASVVRDGGDWPIPLWQQLQAMEIAFRVEDGFDSGPGSQ